MLHVLGLSFKKSSTDSVGGSYFLISHVVRVDFAQNWADLLCSQMASVAEFIAFSPDPDGMEQGKGCIYGHPAQLNFQNLNEDGRKNHGRTRLNKELHDAGSKERADH
jgi:hypothetical protein